jgi:hypothetical protein
VTVTYKLPELSILNLCAPLSVVLPIFTVLMMPVDVFTCLTVPVTVPGERKGKSE